MGPSLRHHEPALPKVLLAFSAVDLIRGCTDLTIRIAIETLPPLFMAGTRFVVAGGGSFPFGCAAGGGGPRELTGEGGRIYPAEVSYRSAVALADEPLTFRSVAAAAIILAGVATVTTENQSVSPALSRDA